MNFQTTIKNYAPLIWLAISVVLSPWGILEYMYRFLSSGLPAAVYWIGVAIWFLSLITTAVVSVKAILDKKPLKLVNGFICFVSIAAILVFGPTFFIVFYLRTL
ncbi:MAG TPA: hypothetical protein VMR99_02740 [Candidatus Paceibacterota bacterium]|nr:hypothetical protein [Candidatus Paceibacterota bacterium]